MKSKKNIGVKKTYYLPKDLAQWIERGAEKTQRSASNYLTTILTIAKGRSGI